MSNKFRDKTIKFYRLHDILSRNGVYNFILGPRGDGKTFAAKELVIKNGLESDGGKQFIYVRRYREELRAARDAFFSDIAYKFPGVRLRVRGSVAEANKGKDKDGWFVIGHFVALSSSQQKKSVSYPNVTIIIFDEFVLSRGAVHYLPNETGIFNDFYSTVDRNQDRTRVLFIANSVSVMNPYFLAFGVKPKNGEQWVRSHDGFIVCQFIDDDEFSAEVYNTRFGKFIQGTDYGEYAVGNAFLDNNQALIRKKSPTARYMATIETINGLFALWVDYIENVYYIQEKRPKEEILWTLITERVSEERTLITYSDKLLQYLRSGYGRGRVFFSSPQARNIFAGVFARG